MILTAALDIPLTTNTHAALAQPLNPIVQNSNPHLLLMCTGKHTFVTEPPIKSAEIE